MAEQPAEQPGFPRHLSSSDSIAWRVERDPVLRSTIAVVMVLDQAPDHAVLRDRLERAARVFPRLRQRIVEIPFNASTPVWSPDPHFDLDFHVREFRATGNGSYRGLLDIAASIAMQAFDWARPLWGLTVVDDLEDGQAALIFKLHHSVTDGVGGVLLLQRIFDFERDPAEQTEELPPFEPGEDLDSSDLVREGLEYEMDRRRDQLVSLVERGGVALRHPISAARQAGDDVASLRRLLAPVKEPYSPIMTSRSPRYHFDAFTVPLDELKAASHRVNGKLNDAFLAGATGALYKYHEAHDAPVTHLRLNMPVNLRGADDSGVGGNKWAPARFALPVNILNIGERMQQMHNVVAQVRAEPALAFVDGLADALNQLPTSVLTNLFGSMLKALDFVASNVPGVPIPVYVGGARVLSMVPFAPTGGASVNFTLLSYEDNATISLNCDPEAVPDPETLLACAVEAFDEVIKYEP